mmetsp:Transcript_24599/g.52441  ORF Transcript_24599/g.52441 Transcript_24599/m.52441 type:complete len:234 (-) Transcript_24599:78-779(-)
MLAHELHVLALVLLGNSYVVTVLNQVGGLLHPKLIALRRECQVQHICNIILQGPAQIAEILWVEGLQVGRMNLHPQHMLVKPSCEESLQHVPIINRFTDDSPREIEVLQMLPVHVGHRVRVVRARLPARLCEEGVVGVKNLLGKRIEPFLHDPASVDAFFALELYVNLRLQFLRRPRPQLVVGIHKHLRPPHFEPNRIASRIPPSVLRAKIGPLVIEVEHCRHPQQGGERFSQ